MTTQDLQHRLNQGNIIILDGGTGTELERRGVPMHALAWSGAALLTHPEVVRQVHQDYIEAGADVIITNTFSTCRNVMEAAGMGDEVVRVNTLAVDLAREALDLSAPSRPVSIAGSISTENTTPIFYTGSRREGRTFPTEQQARANYREQAEIMAEAGVDLIVLEMMRDVPQTTYALEAALATGLPVWVGFSAKMAGDGSTVLLQGGPDNGTTLAQGLEAIKPLGCAMVAIMHSHTEDTTPALAEVKRLWQGPVGAYPNSVGFDLPRPDAEEAISPQGLLAEAQEWVKMGVQAIGVCCGLGPEYIRAFREGLPPRLP